MRSATRAHRRGKRYSAATVDSGDRNGAGRTGADAGPAAVAGRRIENGLRDTAKPGRKADGPGIAHLAADAALDETIGQAGFTDRRPKRPRFSAFAAP